MEQITLNSNAKINLSIDVLKRYENGYHEVDMIMQEIDLSDEVTISKRRDGEIKIYTNFNNIPSDKSNIAYKACDYIREKYGIMSGYDIFLKKQIPVEAGFAGGSTNAASVIKGILELEGLGFIVDPNSSNTQNDSKITYIDNRIIRPLSNTDIAQKIGCDVSFFMNGGSARARGLGECLDEVENNLNYYLLLIKPDLSISTKWVYQNLDLEKVKVRPDTDKIVLALKNNDIKMLADNMANVLETVVCAEYPIIQKIKNKLLDLNAAISLMCGSGSGVYGIFENYNDVLNAYELLSKEYDKIFICRPVKKVVREDKVSYAAVHGGKI